MPQLFISSAAASAFGLSTIFLLLLLLLLRRHHYHHRRRPRRHPHRVSRSRMVAGAFIRQSVSGTRRAARCLYSRAAPSTNTRVVNGGWRKEALKRCTATTIHCEAETRRDRSDRIGSEPKQRRRAERK